MNKKGLSNAIIILIFISAALLNSCENPDTGDPGPDMYISGFYVNGNNDERACYWHNGTRYDLSAPNNNADSRANHMVISGSDLYFAGYYTSSVSGEGTIPCFWKNYSCTPLGVTKGRATAIFVDGTDVYVAGYYGDSPNQRACYWKNDSAGIVNLPGTGATRLDTGSSIWVDTDTIYIGGNYYDNGGPAYIPCRWEAPKTTQIPVANPYALTGGSINDITVTVTGTRIACGNANTSTAYYWQDTTNYTLPYSGAPSIARAYALTMNGAAVYSGGYYSNGGSYIPCYWFNNTTAVPLDNPVGDDAAVLDIQYYSANNTLYSAGYYTDGAGDTVPCYWTETTKHDLPGYKGRAIGIVVIP